MDKCNKEGNQDKWSQKHRLGPDWHLIGRNRQWGKMLIRSLWRGHTGENPLMKRGSKKNNKVGQPEGQYGWNRESTTSKMLKR